VEINNTGAYSFKVIRLILNAKTLDDSPEARNIAIIVNELSKEIK